MSASQLASPNRFAQATRLAGAPVELAVFVVAALARVARDLHGGGLAGAFSYDPGVYYAASDGLTFGRLPYRDYTFLHPPGITLVLFPFAMLGRIAGDHTGFVLATLAMILLGAVCSVLVVRIARSLGLAPAAAAVGGLTYALSYGSIAAEYEVRLEPLGNLLMLAGLLALVKSATAARPRPMLLVSGAALGAAAAVKIWWVVPLLVVLAWQLLVQRRPSAVGWVAAGGAVAIAAICGPFFLAAPHRMLQMVVLEQLGRPRQSSSPFVRAGAMLGLKLVRSHLGTVAAVVVAVPLLVLVVLIVRAAWRNKAMRLFVVLGALQVAVLLAAPSFFAFYTDFAVPAFALTVAGAVAGAATGAVPDPDLQADRRSGRAHRWPPLLFLAAGALLSLAWLGTGSAGTAAFPRSAVTRAVSAARCVTADEPMSLILTDRLSSDFGRRCPDWVDVSGRTYGSPYNRRSATGHALARRDNPVWQRGILTYLRSGDAAIVMRAQTGIGRADVRALRRGGVLYRGHGVTVYRVRHAAR